MKVFLCVGYATVSTYITEGRRRANIYYVSVGLNIEYNKRSMQLLTFRDKINYKPFVTTTKLNKCHSLVILLIIIWSIPCVIPQFIPCYTLSHTPNHLAIPSVIRQGVP